MQRRISSCTLRIIDFRLSVTTQRRSAVKTIRIGILADRRFGFSGVEEGAVQPVLASRAAAALAVKVMADDVMAATRTGRMMGRDHADQKEYRYLPRP